MNRLGLDGFLNGMQLWGLNCFLHDLYPWKLYNRVESPRSTGMSSVLSMSRV